MTPPKRNIPSGVKPATIALIVAQVHRHQARHNCLPSTSEVANELEYHVTTVRKAWMQALDTGQLSHPPPRCSETEETKAKQAWGATQHTGVQAIDCAADCGPIGSGPGGAGAVGHFDAWRESGKDEQDMTTPGTPRDWLTLAAARDAARQRWIRLATAKRPNTLLVASAESELFAAGGDMTDLLLLRQRAWRIIKEATDV